MPKVSVIITAYNKERYLPEAIESVLSQTCRDFEIIIVDDGSKDNTSKIADKYIAMYSDRIRYFYQKNLGPAAARNRGIREAKGDYIALLDGDDMYLPEKLGKSINFLQTNGFDWVVTTQYQISDIEYTKDQQAQKRGHLNQDFLDASGTRIELLKHGIFELYACPIYPSHVLVKRECFNKVGYFDASFFIGDDTDMWMRLEEAGFLGGYLDEPLIYYRVNPSSITKKNNSSGLRDTVALAGKHARILGVNKPLIRESYSNFLWRCSELLFNSDKYWDSFKCFCKSWSLSPSIEKLKKTLRFVKRRI